MILYSLMKTWQHIKNNPESMEKYLIREKVIDTIRSFFKKDGFHEVFTPILVPIPSIEPNLEVFKTELKTSKGIKRDGFLIMSPEFSIKKLLAAGIGNCFEITKCFRNEEEVSKLHNPEFTMLEWYRTESDYKRVMTDFENLFCEIIKNVNPNSDQSKWEYQGQTYDLSRPWPRISFEEAFRKYADKNLKDIKDEDFYKTFFNEVEPKILASRKPIFLYDYPISQAALARPKREDPRFAERFEVFVAGIELGNCFSELTDGSLQKERFEKDLDERKSQGKTEYPIDEDLIDALNSGIPTVSGIAVGVDRLVMLAADAASISETLFFPGSELFDL